MSVSFAAQSAERRKLSAEEDWPLGGAKIFHDAASTCETEAGLAGFGSAGDQQSDTKRRNKAVISIIELRRRSCSRV